MLAYDEYDCCSHSCMPLYVLLRKQKLNLQTLEESSSLVISLIVLDDLLADEEKFDSNVLMLTSKIFSKNIRGRGKKVIASFY